MANERTFLAWLRTSLAFVTIGVGVAQLFRLETKAAKASINGVTVHLVEDPHSPLLSRVGKALSTLSILFGIFTLVVGIVRYYHTQSMLTKDVYPTSRVGVGFVAVFLVVLVVLSFVMVANI